MYVEIITKLFNYGNAEGIVGSKFSFECESGSHTNLLVGTILGFEVSDCVELLLTVSNREFGGLELRSFGYSDGKWFAMVDKELPELAYKFPGTLTLLA